MHARSERGKEKSLLDPGKEVNMINLNNVNFFIALKISVNGLMFGLRGHVNLWKGESP